MENFITIITYYLVQLKIVGKLSVIPSIAILVNYYIAMFYDTLVDPKRPSIISKIFKWYVGNEDYIFIILSMIVVAHLLGTWKYAKLRKFNLKKNIVGFFIMLILAITGGFIFEAMNIIVHKDSAIKDYLVIVTRLILFLYPARSAWKSMSVISNGKFPKDSWTKLIDSFEENYDLSKLTDVRKGNKNVYRNDYDSDYNSSEEFNENQKEEKDESKS